MGRLTFSEARQISIIQYLSSLGFEPAKIRGVDHWYNSPYRPDHDPSFKVDAEQNVWYDHGEGIGGTIIDLGMRLNQCSSVEFLTKLSEEQHRLDLPMKRHVFPPKAKENKVEILHEKPLTDEGLLFYLHQRGINTSLANQFCKQIDFSIKGRAYCAIGFQNQAGGWELRNAWFKGSSSPKDITLLRVGQSKKITISEGFIDHLSLLAMGNAEIKNLLASSDFLILNSLSFLNKNHDLIKSYPERNLFLDNDPAAAKAKAILSLNDITFMDRSGLYIGHKDINEFLVHQIKQSNQLKQQKTKRHSL